ncbi:hypothetical protein BGZ58_010735 [Dissophora ornata]|nr:hypothetical protein BGZ58_010735 [Dissophora ornata]
MDFQRKRGEADAVFSKLLGPKAQLIIDNVMRFPRATGPAITAKEFAQWLAPFQNQCRPRSARLSSPHLSDTPWQKIANEERSSTNHTAATEERQGLQDIGIAVSGGVDSMALVTLLSRHYGYLNADGSNSSRETRLHALIVDHKLRDNSTEEAAFVAQQVQKMNVTPHVLTLSWSSNNISGNEGINLSTIMRKPDRIHLETQARLQRYKAIAQQCHALQIRDLFVGHHAGDQVETVLFRFSRASGVDGLAGIQNMAPLGVVNVAEALDIRVLRPLLNVSKVYTLQ